MSEFSLYKNKSDNKQLNKEFTLVKTFGRDAFKLLDNTGVTRPVVIVNAKIAGGSVRDYLKANYAYLSDTVRYYFIENVELLNGGMVKLYLKVDVLQSFASDIGNCSGLVERQEFLYSPYFVDTMLPVKAGRIIERYDFPTFFRRDLNNTSNCITITVNGG